MCEISTSAELTAPVYGDISFLSSWLFLCGRSNTDYGRDVRMPVCVCEIPSLLAFGPYFWLQAPGALISSESLWRSDFQSEPTVTERRPSDQTDSHTYTACSLLTSILLAQCLKCHLTQSVPSAIILSRSDASILIKGPCETGSSSILCYGQLNSVVFVCKRVGCLFKGDLAQSLCGVAPFLRFHPKAHAGNLKLDVHVTFSLFCPRTQPCYFEGTDR